MENFFYCFAGSLISWFISYWFARESSRELKAETKRLRLLNGAILQALENAGLARVRRDGQGEVIGFEIDLNGTSQGTTSLSATIEVARRGMEEKEP